MAQMYDHNHDPKKDIAFPFFYEDTQEDQAASKKNGGVPVMIPLIKVRIKIPGSRDEVDRPVEDCDKKRWPTIWAQFEKGLKQQLDGVPLAEFATATASERATLAQMGCLTVEQVAGLADNVSTKIGLHSMRRKAIKFLEDRNDLGNVGKLKDEIAALRKELEGLKSGNTDSTVPEGDAGDGLQPALDIPKQSKPGRQKTGTAG